jgi:hypothetical protein
LLHRHSVSADVVFWAYLVGKLEQPYLHLDYSQNIALKPKSECQSEHFSGKEQTLHCAVLAYPTRNNYIYHLSDDTIHDAIMTFYVLESIMSEHPELIEGGKLIIKSDNCSTQYKCRRTFIQMKKLAAQFKCDIFWFYGEAGHGRGLVDAMSSFGCKKLLKDTILREDVWFKDAKEMTEHLIKETAGHGNKEYYFVDEVETAKRRRKKAMELKREGCMSFCLMAVNSEGQWMVRQHLDIDDDNIVNMTFDDPEYLYDINNIEYEEYDDDEDIVKNMVPIPDEQCFPVIFEMVEPKTFIGLRSDSESLEEFYIVEVVYKRVAEDYEKDDHGHVISKGVPFFCVNYLEKSAKSTHKTVKYTRSKTTSVFVNVGEIFAPNIQMSENLSLSGLEYQSLLAELF